MEAHIFSIGRSELLGIGGRSWKAELTLERTHTGRGMKTYCTKTAWCGEKDENSEEEWGHSKWVAQEPLRSPPCRTTYHQHSTYNSPECPSHQGSKPRHYPPHCLKHGENYVPWSLHRSLHSSFCSVLLCDNTLISAFINCSNVAFFLSKHYRLLSCNDENGNIIQAINDEQQEVLTNTNGGKSIQIL